MIALAIASCTFLLLLVSPRKAYPWAIAATVPTYAWLCWALRRPLSIRDDWGDIDRLIVSVALLLALLPALGRFLFDIRRHGLALSPDLDWKPTQASCIFVTIWAGAWLLTPETAAFAGAGLSIAVGVVLSTALFGAAKRLLRYREALIAAGIALITGMTAILIWPSSVVAAAERRASARPYCLVVAHGSDYRVAHSLLDLTPLIMRGREGGRSATNFHAEILIPGEIRRNWSYRDRDFIDQARDNEPPYYVAEIGFAQKLPWF